MITNNSVVEIQTLVVNHKSRPVKLNPGFTSATVLCKNLCFLNTFDLQRLHSTEISPKVTVILFPCEPNTERNVPETEIWG